MYALSAFFTGSMSHLLAENSAKCSVMVLPRGVPPSQIKIQISMDNRHGGGVIGLE
jgi:hypothetical protein